MAMMQMILETADNNQTKLKGQFAANKDPKRPIFSFKPQNPLKRFKVWSWDMNTHKFLLKTFAKLCEFYLAFTEDAGYEGTHLVLPYTQYRFIRNSVKFPVLDVP